MGKRKFNEQTSIDYYKISKEIISYWNSNNIFEKSINSRSKDKIFPFYEGPPSANGMPGIHHVMARTIKDIFCRYKTLKGYRVYRKGGWDTHGLPVELQVEKNLGITKDDIGNKISVAKYNEECNLSYLMNTQMFTFIHIGKCGGTTIINQTNLVEYHSQRNYKIV